MINYLFLKTVSILTYPPAAAACRQVLPKSSGVSISNPTRMNTFYMQFNIKDVTLHYSIMSRNAKSYTPPLSNYELQIVLKLLKID